MSDLFFLSLSLCVWIGLSTGSTHSKGECLESNRFISRRTCLCRFSTKNTNTITGAISSETSSCFVRIQRVLRRYRSCCQRFQLLNALQEQQEWQKAQAEAEMKAKDAQARAEAHAKERK